MNKLIFLVPLLSLLSLSFVTNCCLFPAPFNQEEWERILTEENSKNLTEKNN